MSQAQPPLYIGMDYSDQIFLISACIQNHIVEYLDCDFVGIRMVTFLFGMGVEWLG